MDSAPAIAGFDTFGLSPAVLKAIQDQGYETPTPIQAACIPELLANRDLLGQAQTGTGKTAAFALPLLSNLSLGSRDPQILVLTPTRELALQVAEACQSYARHLGGFHVLPVYGGQGMSLQLRQLQRGAHVIVGTPGRVIDHLKRGTLKLGSIKSLVLDEADEMLKMGFIDEIEWIFEQAPEQRQVALFSATMPDSIRKVAKKYLRDPVEIKIKSKSETVTAIDQVHYVVSRDHKMDAMTRILEVEEFDGMIVFVRTKLATVEVADKLEAHGFAAEALNGDMNQAMRERTVDRLKRGKLDIVVATDVAARGLDVERISHVVNYDIPNDPESYVHRIGRTGRAGRKGKALLFVQPRENRLLKAIERSIRQQIPAMELPSAGDLSEHRIDRFTTLIRETLTQQDLDYYYQLIHRMTQEQEMSELDIAAALTYLGQKERPFIVKEVADSAARRTRAKSGKEPGTYQAATPQDKAKRKPKTKTERGSRKRDVPMETYRLQVGSKHGVTPREVVGALANEAGLDGAYIGQIQIAEDHTLVDLPEGMPGDVFKHLQRVYVCNQPLRLKPVKPHQAGTKAQPDKAKKAKKRDKKPKHKKTAPPATGV
ncbi:DEAD/DEAH box helicase [Sedimenticola selenatireducens]|uniref:DEAD/DEAH box helicase n=1 Tax=Sedimenticola selenatireducens TaxID=191960 RepID=UPI003F4AC421